MIGTLLHHWQLALGAVMVGLVLGVAFVAAYYLAAPVRLRLAADPTERARVLEGELARLRRLGDEAAVHEEHGLAGAGELREEAELRELLLLLACAGERHRGRY